MRSSPSTFGFLLATLALLILSTNPLVGAAPTNLTELVDSSALANSITDADFTVVARNFTGNPDTGETLCPEPSVCFKSCYPDRTNTGMCQVAYAKQDDSGDACTLIICTCHTLLFTSFICSPCRICHIHCEDRRSVLLSPTVIMKLTSMSCCR